MTSTRNNDNAGESTRSRSAGELIALEQLLAEIGLSDRFSGDATLVGEEVLIRSRHRLVEAVGTAQLLIGAAAAAIWLRRTGEASDVTVDTIDALHSLHSAHFVWQGGAYLQVGAEYVPVNGFYPTKDGRRVFLCAGPPYMKLLNGYLDLFGCANNRQAIAEATMRYTAPELEEALAAIGVPGCRAFALEEWLAHPQGRLLAATPVIEFEKLTEGEPVPFAHRGEYPLSGTRVLDFTHVLAGPHSTQCLAEFGADVLHISSALHPDTLPQHLGVDMGKYCAYLDLGQTDQLKAMHDLAANADVFVNSYRDSVGQRFGLSPVELAARSPKGIVALSINTYGHAGPWRQRAGFDPNGQAASGFAASEGSGVSSPKVSPVSYLADLLTAYLGAAGMMAALMRRATEGGSYLVKVSLTRSAMWVQELGLLDRAAVEALPEADVYPYRSETAATSFGPLETLASPVNFSALQLPHNERLVPYGADPAQWP